MNRDRFKSLLEAAAKTYSEDMDDWCVDSASTENDAPEETCDAELRAPSWTPAAMLGPLPADEIDRLWVSRVSRFGDNYWDFQEEGSPAYLGTARVNLERNLSDALLSTDRAAEELLHLVKCLIFYNLPPHAIFVRVRSYNTVPVAASPIFTIARILCSKGILVDHSGNGGVLHANRFTQSDLLEWLDSNENLTVKYHVLYQIVNWQKLSKEGYLPPHLSLPLDIVPEQMLQDAQRKWQEYRESCVGHLPIPLDDLGVVVPFCIEMVEKYAEDILAVHHDVTEGLQDLAFEATESERVLLAIKRRSCSDLWSIKDYRSAGGAMSNAAERDLEKAVRARPEWQRVADEVGSLQKLSNSELILLAEKVGVDLETFRGGSVLYDLKPLRHHYQSMVGRLRTACETLILLVTGMRRVEFAHLRAGAARKRGKDDYRLKFKVFKTSEASSGDATDLPIPETAYRAFQILERITAPARNKVKSDRLFINIFHLNHGSLRHVGDLYTQLAKLSEFLGLSEPIHPHQFRKSLAMFFIYHDTRNLTLLKRLFSHKSLTMTLKYIVQLPGMSEEIRRGVIETHMDILLDLMDAVDTGKIGGSAGRRFKESVEKSNFFARLNDDGYESLRMFVETLLEHETKIVSRCPMGVICTKSHVAIVDAGPEPCDCDIVNCDNAIFTEHSIQELKDDIRFHTNVILANKRAGADQRRHSEERVRGCLARLSELIGAETVAKEYPELYASAA